MGAQTIETFYFMRIAHARRWPWPIWQK